MRDADQDRNETRAESTQVSRRRLLKLLAAAGVAAGAGRLLPAQWVTPTAAADEYEILELCPEGQSLLTISKSRAGLIDNESNTWNVSFFFIDNAGFLTANASLTAVAFAANSSEPNTVYNGVPLAVVGGLGPVNTSSLGYTCNDTLLGLVNSSSAGEGYFLFDYPASNISTFAPAADADATLEWFLADERMSNIEETILSDDPTAVSLRDLTVESAAAGAAGAAVVVGAAALGALTVKALQDENKS